jgi:3-oxoacyl-[acyl-carrier protein] reductase
MSKLQGKVVLVTGAGTGLGKETALLFAREGAAVVICGRRNHKIQEVKEEILQIGGTVLDIHADVSREIDVDRLISATLSEFGRIDILINNAAVFENKTIAETDLDSTPLCYRSSVA